LSVTSFNQEGEKDVSNRSTSNCAIACRNNYARLCVNAVISGDYVTTFFATLLREIYIKVKINPFHSLPLKDY